MKHILHTSIERYRAVITGALCVFGFFVFLELFDQPVFFAAGLLLGTVALWAAKKTAHHFHYHHHHEGDSVIDVLPVSVLFIANIFHPAVDGLSFWEIFMRNGAAAGIVFGGGIVLHEIIRQSALIAVFSQYAIRWYWIVGTAFFGIALGIGAGMFNATFFHTYEYIGDLATVFAYTFIIGEFWYTEQKYPQRNTPWYVFLGMLIGVAIMFYVNM